MLKLFVLLMIATVGFGSEVKVNFRSTERLSRKGSIYLERIVNGSPVKEGELPYQISMQEKYSNNLHFCGGTIIKDNVILTAAHCVYHFVNNPGELQVVAGLVSLSNPGPNAQTREVKRIIYHPEYSGAVSSVDIALLILESPFRFTNYVQQVALPAKGTDYTGDAIVSGWGSISNTSYPIFPDRMMKAVLPLITFNECKTVWSGNLLSEVNNICTGPIGGNVAPCTCDSGGPLVKEISGATVVIGAVSWGQVPCGHGNPTVYVKVSSFIDFILQNMIE